MNIETGKLVTAEMLKSMAPAERAKYIEVKRDLTKIEALQKRIKLYSPCGCVSGKKFKFCCRSAKP